MLFDLDGVIADTATLHRRSWEMLSAELGVPFEAALDDQLRGRSRPDSVALFLAAAGGRIAAASADAVADRKQALFLELLSGLTPEHALPGIRALAGALRARGVRIAVASSSRNARVVLERLELLDAFDAVVDANDVPDSKPDPRVFLEAAAQIGVAPAACVVVEDGQAGVDAALAAGMRVVAIGPRQRFRGASLCVASPAELTAERVIGLSRTAAP